MVRIIGKDANTKEGKVLVIDKKLPQIVLPENKVDMFIDWWNTDIRFEKTIPTSFTEGYLRVNGLNRYMTIEQDGIKSMIKTVARKLGSTYREVENKFKQFITDLDTIILYFKFKNGNSLELETYDLSNKIISNADISFGEESDVEDELSRKLSLGDYTSVNEYLEKLNYLIIGILATCMWYIATTTRNTKYIYENKTPVVTGRKKGIVQVSDTKFIKTPIYDMSKIRTVHVDKLVSRKKGWTYSHAFQVHGHYRHYQSGKVIFIEPYVKGKNKDFMAQTIIIEPE